MIILFLKKRFYQVFVLAFLFKIFDFGWVLIKFNVKEITFDKKNNDKRFDFININKNVDKNWKINILWEIAFC